MTEAAVDWGAFANQVWERHHTVLDAVDGLPLGTPDELFAGFVRCAAERDGVRLFSGNLQATSATFTIPGVLPRLEDGSFSVYMDRLQRDHGFSDVTIVCDAISRFVPELWARAHAVIGGLVDVLGLPTHGFHVDLFVGRYERTPFGAHLDPLSNFMSVVEGRRTLYLWDARARREHGIPEELWDYEPYLDHASVVELSPGQLLYWPSSTLHVGACHGDCISVNVDYFVPTATSRRRGQALQQLTRRLRTGLDEHPALEPMADVVHRRERRGEVSQIPRRFIDVVERASTLLGGNTLRIATELWLCHLSLGGLDVTPEPAPLDRLDHDDLLAHNQGYSFAWMTVRGEILVGAGGYLMVFPDVDRARALLRHLDTDGPFRVAELIAGFAGEGTSPDGSSRTLTPAAVTMLLVSLVRRHALVRR